jgi:hypothetical protein
MGGLFSSSETKSEVVENHDISPIEYQGSVLIIIGSHRDFEGQLIHNRTNVERLASIHST